MTRLANEFVPDDSQVPPRALHRPEQTMARAPQLAHARATLATLGDPRWLRLRARDASADGSFYYSVKTTGVYCRPSCGARTPRPENVTFHATPAEAERAGFRACRRCKPNQAPAAERAAAQVEEMCRLIEHSESSPSLEALAQHVGLSTFHAHRLFKAATGITPKSYSGAVRARRMRGELRAPGSVTSAIYGAGYGSSGRFYAEAPRRLGMQPRAFKTGANAEQIRFALGQCSLGAILVAATPRGVCAISLGDDPEPLLHELERQFPGAELRGGDAEFEAWVAQSVALVERPGDSHRLPLDIRGTAFQERVWKALRGIAPGKTASYAELAQRIGSPGAFRAVASACAANRLAVAIPCHRVVRTDGSSSGYRWGVERKRELLEREGRG
jgi:AraC family transcriptional regulator, regulatory protein of adaptative response / methylated-DNA-[protein]-cysteine methyltransferase